jgi:hypothetical protein
LVSLLIVGVDVGCADGLLLGMLEGALGFTDGSRVGSLDGAMVEGHTDGTFFSFVGDMVGISDKFDGSRVGVTVSITLGNKVALGADDGSKVDGAVVGLVE